MRNGRKYTDATQTYTLTIKVTKLSAASGSADPMAAEFSTTGIFTLVWAKDAAAVGCINARWETVGTGVPK